MLIEPTESETLEELDRYVINCILPQPYIKTSAARFCDAMIQIRKEADDIISGRQPKDNNVLKNAPHPVSVLTGSDAEWNRWAILWLRLDTQLRKHFTDRIRARRQRILCHIFTTESSGRQSPALMTVSFS